LQPAEFREAGLLRRDGLIIIEQLDLLRDGYKLLPAGNKLITDNLLRPAAKFLCVPGLRRLKNVLIIQQICLQVLQQVLFFGGSVGGIRFDGGHRFLRSLQNFRERGRVARWVFAQQDAFDVVGVNARGKHDRRKHPPSLQRAIARLLLGIVEAAQRLQRIRSRAEQQR
jgi:hypothetical protein